MPDVVFLVPIPRFTCNSSYYSIGCVFQHLYCFHISVLNNLVIPQAGEVWLLRLGKLWALSLAEQKTVCCTSPQFVIQILTAGTTRRCPTFGRHPPPFQSRLKTTSLAIWILNHLEPYYFCSLWWGIFVNMIMPECFLTEVLIHINIV